MIPEAFGVLTTTAFDRSARKLSRAHPEFPKQFAKAVSILESDPFNRSRRHPIKKLEASRQAMGNTASVSRDSGFDTTLAVGL